MDFFLSFFQIVDRQIVEAELDIIGVSEDDDMLLFLDRELDDFLVPRHFYLGNIDDLVHQIPIKIRVKHINNLVLSIQSPDLAEIEESEDPVESTKSVDPVESAKSEIPV